MSADALAATGVCRGYGRQSVLDGFSLTLGPSRFEALMGPSGSGKSTFLHIAAGLLAADAGQVLVGGENVTSMSDSAAAKFRRRHVGVVFQAFNLLSEKTVAENILMPLALEGRAGAPESRARLASLASRLGLEPLLSKRPEQLSGGEQQRVAIARALVAEPDVVLADEPTGNLDAQSAKSICALLKELNASEKSAILVVTHDPVVAATASRVHFLKDGRIAASHDTNGDPELVSRLYLECYR
jgi:putative ABC transport system ATP-binding protein